MKKQSSNKINLPKKKRFSRFFLRRLLICTLAAAIGGAMLLQHSYLKDAENYTSDCSDAWKKRIMWLRSEISQDSDNENITTDEKYIQKYIQTKLNRITTSLDIVTNSPEPYGDHAAMLIDAENLKYYVAQPEIQFHVVDAKNTENPNAERKHRGIIDNSELSEQIETELRDYAKKHYTRYALLIYVYNLIILFRIHPSQMRRPIRCWTQFALFSTVAFFTSRCRLRFTLQTIRYAVRNMVL